MSVESQLDYSLPIPILASSYPASLVESNSLTIHYELGYPIDLRDISMEYRIMVANNNSVLLTENSNLNGSEFSVDISSLKDTIKTDIYYKIQCRLRKEVSGEPEDTAAAPTYTYSLWSNLMALKFINKPTIKLYANNSSTQLNDGESGSSSFIFNLIPNFTCNYITKDNELLSSYRFILSNSLEDEIIYSTDWIKYENIKIESADEGMLNSFNYTFPFALDPDILYELKVEVKTINGYEDDQEGIFNAASLEIDEIPDSEISIKEEVDIENGLIKLIVVPESFQNKRYVLVRRSEKDDFTFIEDLTSFIFPEGKVPFIYNDCLIESGIQYEYGIQYEDNNGRRIKYKWLNKKIECNYEYVFLYSQGKQLKLKYNNTMNSFKHTRQEAKQDMLGNKYPIISRNTDSYYAEFPINALITFNMDELNLFFQEGEKGYYYNDNLVIPNRKYQSIISQSSFNREEDKIVGQNYLIWNNFDTNLTDNNTFIEKVFREKVEEFLSDGQPKVFRSPTEGIFIIGLINVSFTPNQQLGRMISSVAATAYEIDEFNLNNLLKYDIISEFQTHNDKEFEYITEYQQYVLKEKLKGKNLSDLLIDNRENYIHDSFEYIEIYNGSLSEISIKIKTKINNSYSYSDSIKIKPNNKYIIDIEISDLTIEQSIVNENNYITFLCKHKLKLNKTEKILEDNHMLYRIAQLNPETISQVTLNEDPESFYNLYQYIEKAIINYINGAEDRINSDWGKPNYTYEPTEGYLDKDKELYLLGLEWIRIEAPAGTIFRINGSEITMNETGIYRYNLDKEYITSLEIKGNTLLSKILIDYKYILAHFKYKEEEAIS